MSIISDLSKEKNQNIMKIHHFFLKILCFSYFYICQNMSLVSKIFTTNKTANKYLSVKPKKFYAASDQGAMRYPFVAFGKNHTVV